MNVCVERGFKKRAHPRSSQDRKERREETILTHKGHVEVKGDSDYYLFQ